MILLAVAIFCMCVSLVTPFIFGYMVGKLVLQDEKLKENRIKACMIIPTLVFLSLVALVDFMRPLSDFVFQFFDSVIESMRLPSSDMGQSFLTIGDVFACIIRYFCIIGAYAGILLYHIRESRNPIADFIWVILLFGMAVFGFWHMWGYLF